MRDANWQTPTPVNLKAKQHKDSQTYEDITKEDILQQLAQTFAPTTASIPAKHTPQEKETPTTSKTNLHPIKKEAVFLNPTNLYLEKIKSTLSKKSKPLECMFKKYLCCVVPSLKIKKHREVSCLHTMHTQLPIPPPRQNLAVAASVEQFHNQTEDSLRCADKSPK